MEVIVVFLLAVLFVAAVWGREAAQKLFRRGMKVAGVLVLMAASVIIMLAINLKAPSQTEMQQTLNTAQNSAYHVPLEQSTPGYTAPLTNPAPQSAPEYGNPKIGIQPELLRPDNGAPYGVPAGYGLYVRAVFPNTTAQAAGIRAGDYISQVDGQWITDVDGLNRHNIGKRVGDIIVLCVLRGGKQYLVRVPLGTP